MSDIWVRVLAGICGAILFAVLNRYVLTLSGPAWLAAMAVVFVAAFVAALILQKAFGRHSTVPHQSVGSRNTAGGKMKIRVEDVPKVNVGTSDVGSENKSKSDMDVAIKAGDKK